MTKLCISYLKATQQLREPPLQVGHVELVNVPGKVRLIYIYNSFSFEATEMVLTLKWDRIQTEIQILARSERTHASTKISTYRAASPKYIKGVLRGRCCTDFGGWDHGTMMEPSEFAQ